jgi:hypothetical protein
MTIVADKIEWGFADDPKYGVAYLHELGIDPSELRNVINLWNPITDAEIEVIRDSGDSCGCEHWAIYSQADGIPNPVMICLYWMVPS